MTEQKGSTGDRQYRGKRLDNGEWIEGDLIRECTGKMWIVISYLSGEYGERPCFDWHEVDPATVGQYTGRNTVIDEKPIYRGDILSFVKPNYDGSDSGVETGYVDWSDSALSWIVCENIGSDREDWLYLILHNDDGVEVIGNIHENPELLTVMDL